MESVRKGLSELKNERVENLCFALRDGKKITDTAEQIDIHSPSTEFCIIKEGDKACIIQDLDKNKYRVMLKCGKQLPLQYTLNDAEIILNDIELGNG